MYENAARSVATDEFTSGDACVWEGCTFPHRIRGKKASRSRRHSGIKSITSIQALESIVRLASDDFNKLRSGE